MISITLRTPHQSISTTTGWSPGFQIVCRAEAGTLAELTAPSLSQLLQPIHEERGILTFITLRCMAKNVSYEQTLLESSWIFKLNLQIWKISSCLIKFARFFLLSPAIKIKILNSWPEQNKNPHGCSRSKPGNEFHNQHWRPESIASALSESSFTVSQCISPYEPKKCLAWWAPTFVNNIPFYVLKFWTFDLLSRSYKDTLMAQVILQYIHSTLTSFKN